MTNKVMIVQALTTAGAAVGALFSGNITYLGIWKCIMLTNILVCLGALFTLAPEFAALCVGRFLYGMAVGGFSVFCPKYISETAPIEVKGPAGALSQVCITFGILVAFCCGLGIGDVDDDDIDSFEVQYYWYILFTLPIVFSII
jgi:MFS family permease